jgi:hypothetical protein
MADTIVFACPGCSRTVVVDDRPGEIRCACPGCGRGITVGPAATGQKPINWSVINNLQDLVES